MAKGNHVFNHFNKTLNNAFSAFLRKTDPDVLLATALVSSSSRDATTLVAKYPKAWPKFKEIVTSPQFSRWDEMQDNEEVALDDANSKEYGKAAKSFVAEVEKIAAKQRGSAGACWEEMLKRGYDGAAANAYIKQDPRGQAERTELINASAVWVRGPLNYMVCTWLQYLRLDVEGKK